jgi:hypothetical protein
MAAPLFQLFKTGIRSMAGGFAHLPTRNSIQGLALTVLWYTIRRTDTFHSEMEPLMSFEIRKIVSYIEETFIEGGKASDKPVTMVGLAVVMKNPWVGNGLSKT